VGSAIGMIPFSSPRRENRFTFPADSRLDRLTRRGEEMRICLTQDWTEYSRFLPDGWRALGVVDAGEGDCGALVLTSDDTYRQLNGTLIRTLDQAEVQSLLRCAAAPDSPRLALVRSATALSAWAEDVRSSGVSASARDCATLSCCAAGRS
jgi:hypothetical protein